MTITLSDENRGLYAKYIVTKADGTPVPGPLFILRYSKDPHARVALAAYADSCEGTHPQLGIDLRAQLAKLRMSANGTDCRNANPDIWRMTFANHIEAGIRFADLAGDDLNTARGFDRDLTRAFSVYLNSTESDRERQFLVQIITIAARAYAFYVQLDHKDLAGLTYRMMSDLGGLSDVLGRR